MLASLIERRRNGDYVPAIDLAAVHAAIGDLESAIDALDRGCEERNALMWARIHWPDFDALHDHPRWIALAQRLGRNAPFVWSPSS